MLEEISRAVDSTLSDREWADSLLSDVMRLELSGQIDRAAAHLSLINAYDILADKALEILEIEEKKEGE